MVLQISLATRYKPVPLTQYSAQSTTKTNRRHSRSPSVNSWPSSSAVAPLRGRPASADVGQLSRTRKSSFRSTSTTDDEVKGRSRPQSTESSSNILRLLLSETINRGGEDNKISSQHSMDELEIDSQQSEEEIPEECPEDIEAVPTNKGPAPNTTNLSQLAKKSTELNKNLSFKVSTNSWLKKPATDLPGRVSFSSNDVYEIDYSDFSDDSPFDVQERSQKPNKKFVHFRQEPSGTKEEAPSLNKMDYAAKSDSSIKIIEDYKKEIENLNRRHEEEMTKLTTEQNGVLFFDNSNLVLPGVDVVDSVDKYLETIKETTDSLEVFEQLETEIQAEESVPEEEGYEDEEEHEEMIGLSTPKGITLQQTTVSTWDNSKRADEKASSSSSEDGKREDGDVKPKRGEEEERSRIKFNVKTPKKMSIMNNRSFLRKPKTPQSTRFNPIKTPINNPVQPNPKMRKSKSVSNLKEENTLRDFQMEMDKVDSWMSMHSNKDQMGDSMRTLMLMKRPQSSHQGQYNKEWRDTPSTKTDDEGNFSLEEANDCYSNESTTYDELVSIIKEIEADKKKTDERKNLQADVEFKLKTVVSDGEVQDAPSDPVR